MLGYLRIASGPEAGRTIDLGRSLTLVVGRGEKADLQLKDLQVSRLHCELRAGADTLTIVDLGSSAGTFVNGQVVQERQLRHGDLIRLGGTELKLQLAGITDAEEVLAAQKPERQLQASPAAAIGRAISHYELVALLARGRTGFLYRARDRRDGKDVALKLMFDGFADDEEELQRFIRAMSTAISLKHPNIVALFAAGKQGKSCWYAMEYVPGEPLTKVIERRGTVGMLDWQYALKVAVHIARALEAAHDQHVVHRNVMPESILIHRDGLAKLGDLMLAKALDGVKAKAITRPGELVGNLAFMAPERTREDAPVDTRADIYGLGATLYAVLTGHPPFQARTLVETIAQIRQADPVPPKHFQPSIPDELQDVVMTMLAKRPELRYPTPARVVQALKDVIEYNDLDM